MSIIQNTFFVYILIVLGNVSAAVDVDTLHQCKITHILTLDTCPLPRKIIEMPNIKVKFIHLVDQPKEDILSYLQETDCFINEAIENGIILVHWYVFHLSKFRIIQNKSVLCVFCSYYGMSRSAAVVIAYVMKKYGLKYEEALDRLYLLPLFFFK